MSPCPFVTMHHCADFHDAAAGLRRAVPISGIRIVAVSATESIHHGSTEDRHHHQPDRDPLQCQAEHVLDELRGFSVHSERRYMELLAIDLQYDAVDFAFVLDNDRANDGEFTTLFLYAGHCLLQKFCLI